MRKRNLALVLLSIAAAMSISACEGKKTKENEPKAVETPIIAEEPKTLQEAVEQLEKEGKYPVLDRSDTLLGEDKDGNGVRDDIDAYIDSLPDTQEQKAALRQDAKSYNYLFEINYENPNANEIAKVMYETDRALNCIYEKYPKTETDINQYKAYYRDEAIHNMTLNTKKRLTAYLTFDSKLGGMTFKMSKDSCYE